MTALSSILGPGETDPPWLPDPATCAHDRLLARYRNRTAQLEDQPMGYKCQRCLAEFMPFDSVAQRFRVSQGLPALVTKG